MNLIKLLILLIIIVLYSNSVNADIITGLVAYWNLDDGSGNVASDSIGNNDGDLINNPSWNSPGYNNSGYSLIFDGVNQYVSFPSLNDLHFSSAPFSISVWVKTASSAENTIISKRFGPQNDNARVYISSGEVVASFFQTDNTFIGASSSGLSINDDAWHHVAMVVDSSNLYLYVDGNLENTISHNNNIKINNEPWRLGVRNPSESTPSYHNGDIDDVRIYNRILTQSDVSELYDYSTSVGGYNDSGNYTIIEPGECEEINEYGIGKAYDQVLIYNFSNNYLLDEYTSSEERPCVGTQVDAPFIGNVSLVILFLLIIGYYFVVHRKIFKR